MLGLVIKARGLVAWLMLGWTVVALVDSVVRFSADVVSVPLASALHASSAFNLGAVVALVILVCVCLFVSPPAKHAVRLTIASAWVVTIGTVVSAVSFVGGLLWPVGPLAVVMEVVGGVLDLGCKAAATLFLWSLAQGLRQGTLRPGRPLGHPVPPPAPSDRPSWQPVVGAENAWARSHDPDLESSTLIHP